MELLTLLRNEFGHFHPALVHFPIGLVLAGAALEARRTMLKMGPSPAARVLLLLGAVASVAAVGSGLSLFRPGDFRGLALEVVAVHRFLAITGGVVTLLGAGLASRGFPTTRKRLIAYRVCYLSAAALIGGAGHYGGWLVFGLGQVWTP